MELKPLLGPDHPHEPERADLYQKLTLHLWKQCIAADRKRRESKDQQADKEEPDIVSDA